MDIKSLRRTLNISQVELAEKLGLHQTTISRFETGALPIDKRTKLALEALSKEPDDATPTPSEAVAA